MCSKSRIIIVPFVFVLSGFTYAQRSSFEVASVIHAPIQRVWQAFTDPEDLMKWSVKMAEVDLRVGGIIRTNYNANGKLGDEQTFETQVLTFEPERMIAFRPMSAPKNLSYREAYLKIWTVVYFDDLSHDKTGVRISSHGYGPGDTAQQMLALFEKNNERKLQRLNEYVQTSVANANPNKKDAKHSSDEASSHEKNVESLAPLVHVSEINAPLDFVWDAFATSKGLAAWMAPLAIIDLRVGGKMLANYHADGKLGDANTIENTILSFDPQRMISLKATKPPASFPFKDAIAKTWSVMYFEALSPRRTSIRIVGMGYDESEQSQRMRSFFKMGNDWTLKELNKYFIAKSEGSKNTAIREDVDSTSHQHGHVKVTVTRKPLKRLDFEIDVPASRASVWRALATIEGAREFYCPGGRMALKPGGTYEYHFRPNAPPGQRGMEGTTLFTLLPKQMLAGTGSAPPMFPQVQKEKTRWVMLLDELEDHHTRVRMTMVDWPDGKEWDKAFEYFIEHNPVFLEMLYKRFTDGPIDWSARGVEVRPLPPAEKTSWPGRTLKKKVLVKATPSQVWNAWTTQEGLAKFFAKQANVEIRIGGAYELFMQPEAQQGQRGCEGCEILAYVPDKLLAFTWIAPPSIPSLRTAENRTHVILRMKSQADGFTELALYHIGFGQGDDWDTCYGYFDRAWGKVLKRLRASFL